MFVDCESKAGMQDRTIPNSQITASSHWNEHFPFEARLHNQFRYNATSKTAHWGGWCAKKEDKRKFLQVSCSYLRLSCLVVRSRLSVSLLIAFVV